jgi:hypothetical protein
MTNLIVAFHNFANAPNNYDWEKISITSNTVRGAANWNKEQNLCLPSKSRDCDSSVTGNAVKDYMFTVTTWLTVIPTECTHAHQKSQFCFNAASFWIRLFLTDVTHHTTTETFRYFSSGLSSTKTSGNDVTAPQKPGAWLRPNYFVPHITKDKWSIVTSVLPYS